MRLFSTFSILSSLYFLTVSSAFAGGADVYIASSDHVGMHRSLGNGALDEKTSVLLLDGGISDFVISSDGKYLYAISKEHHTLRSFRIRPDHSLAFNGSVINVGPSDPRSLVISPNGRDVYVNIGENRDPLSTNAILNFTVQSDGTLQGNGSAPQPIRGGDDLMMSPDGKRLYAFHFSTGDYTLFDIQQDGKAMYRTTGDSGETPASAVITPNGERVYVAEANFNRISYFKPNGDGLLGRARRVATYVSQGDSPTKLALSADGRFLYVFNPGTPNVASFRIRNDGTLDLQGTPVRLPGAVLDFALAPNGRTIYVTTLDERILSLQVQADGSISPDVNSFVNSQRANGILVFPANSPTAQFRVDSSGATVGDSVSFNAAASTTDGANIVEYQWDFGDGQVESTSSPVVTHQFAQAGSFSVKLTVVNDAHCDDSEFIFTGRQTLCNGTGRQTTIQNVAIQPGAVVPQVGQKNTIEQNCVVPKILGLSLSKAKSKIVQASCKLGKVRKPKRNKKKSVRKGYTLVVASVKPKIGSQLAKNAKIDITLKYKKTKKKRTKK